MNYQDFFEQEVVKIKEEGRYRIFTNVHRSRGLFPKAIVEMQGVSKEATLWCSNDYLGMGHNKHVLEEMSRVILGSGAGAGGTRNISGTTPYHSLLEEELAKWHKCDSALIFTSGYVANETTLSTLASKIPECIVLSDALNHASMIEGISHSRAQKFIFRHNDMEHLKSFLEQIPKNQPKIIAVESVYSMEGDVAPLDEILNLARKYQAFTYVDEVHAVGMYGEEGAGKIHEMKLDGEFDLVQGTLGKAIGCIGGYIAGKKSMVDFIRSFSPGFIFTTALPPAITSGALKSIQILQKSENLRLKHQEIVSKTKEAFSKAKLTFLNNHTHIIPVIIGDAVKCKEISKTLFDEFSIYVQPINYPTVPKGSERFRITPTPYHSVEDINHLVRSLSLLMKNL